MSLNDAVELWAVRAAKVEGGGPSLPYPSMVAMTLSGAVEDPFNVGTLSVFALSDYGPHELPLDMAAARCKSLDSEFYDEYVRAHSGRPKGRALEASWLATDKALYYIGPAVLGLTRWAWDTTYLRPGKTGRQFAKFTVSDSRQTWKLSTGARAFPNLLACASWASQF